MRAEHLNVGQCPDPSQPDARDADCDACREMDGRQTAAGQLRASLAAAVAAQEAAWFDDRSLTDSIAYWEQIAAMQGAETPHYTLPAVQLRWLRETVALRRLAVLLQTNHLADVGQTEPDVIEALLFWAEQVAWPHSGYDPATPWRALAAELREALADWQRERGAS